MKCCRCKKNKSVGSFHKGHNKQQNYCKLCKREYDKTRYQENKVKLTEQRSTYRKKAKDWICNFLLDHPCVDCGEKDIVVLEFDHVRGTKLFNVSTAALASLARVRKEARKCEIRCSNCHQRKTAAERNNFKVKFLEHRAGA